MKLCQNEKATQIDMKSWWLRRDFEQYLYIVHIFLGSWIGKYVETPNIEVYAIKLSVEIHDGRILTNKNSGQYLRSIANQQVPRKWTGRIRLQILLSTFYKWSKQLIF